MEITQQNLILFLSSKSFSAQKWGVIITELPKEGEPVIFSVDSEKISEQYCTCWIQIFHKKQSTRLKERTRAKKELLKAGFNVIVVNPGATGMTAMFVCNDEYLELCK